MLSNPRYDIYETALAELIGADEQVDQNDYGGSVAVTLGDGVRPVSGEFLSFMFFATETGSGAVQTPAGTLLLLAVVTGLQNGLQRFNNSSISDENSLH